jgi:hypothetical protein
MPFSDDYCNLSDFEDEGTSISHFDHQIDASINLKKELIFSAKIPIQKKLELIETIKKSSTFEPEEERLEQSGNIDIMYLKRKRSSSNLHLLASLSEENLNQSANTSDFD